jgi:hypothetical protein
MCRTGLIAEWHFDEGSMGILHDSSGNGDDGAIHGATWAEGKDYALLEDAVSESGAARDIMHRAFSGLVDAGGCRMRWGEGAGMVGRKMGSTEKTWMMAGRGTQERRVAYPIRIKWQVRTRNTSTKTHVGIKSYRS